MKILIDSDVISAFGNPESEEYQKIIAYFSSFPEAPEICLSMLTVYEMEYSLSAFTDEEEKEKTARIFQQFKDSLTIINLSFASAEVYGKLRFDFKKKTGINSKALKRHNIDIALASLAIANRCTLLSRDGIYKDHLQHIEPRLKYQNWAK